MCIHALLCVCVPLFFEKILLSEWGLDVNWCYYFRFLEYVHALKMSLLKKKNEGNQLDFREKAKYIME